MSEHVFVMLWRIAVLMLLVGANGALRSEHQSKLSYVFVGGVLMAILAYLFARSTR